MVSATPDLRAFLGGPKDAGIIVGKVISGSAAEKAGLKVGDLIVSVDGGRVEDPSDVVEALEDQDGKTIEIEVVRDKKTVKVRATIPEVEDEHPSGPRASAARPPRAPRAPLPPPAPAAPPRPPVPPMAVAEAI